MARLLCLLLCCCFANGAAAEEAVEVCFNYGCASSETAVYSEPQLGWIKELLGLANNAEHERFMIGVVVGRLYAWAGEQTPIWADKGGNMADQGVPGSMDCIDHSTTTERLLRMLERRSLFQFHRVVGPVRRDRFLVIEHHAVEIAELGEDGEHFVVDSWFHDNGKPAEVMALNDWINGEDVDD
ncbi:MAG TPA: hypothetical protein VI279_07895 [Rhodocyclaceae bacterium]